MAVYCGVCGDRLCDATENYGGFSVLDNYEGWHREPNKPSKIENTCRDYYAILAAVVTQRANEIVRRNQAVHDNLRAELHAQRQTEAQYKRDEAEFRANWRPKS